MPAREPFEYAVLRIVPRVDREELMNAGVVVYCEARAFLEARIELDEARLAAFAPGTDVEMVRRHLDAVAHICAGGEEGGPIGALPLRERWTWLVAPRSTVIQTSRPHAGLCDDPAATLERLVDTLVRVPPPPS